MRPASVLVAITMIGFVYGQAPATDPHEDPKANGGNRTGDSKQAPPDPQAAPDPVPVRAPNPDTAAPDQPGAGTKPASDTELISAIRAALAADRETRQAAGRIKVIAHAGTVTLQGTVTTAEFRRSVEQKATAIAGKGKITDEIKVKASVRGSRSE